MYWIKVTHANGNSEMFINLDNTFTISRQIGKLDGKESIHIETERGGFPCQESWSEIMAMLPPDSLHFNVQDVR
ncbi:hypothetical protein LCGC14_3155800, partial [marine sediment metagenome]